MNAAMGMFVSRGGLHCTLGRAGLVLRKEIENVSSENKQKTSANFLQDFCQARSEGILSI